MAAAFPLAKLGILVIRRLSRPLAKAVEQRAKNSDKFRDHVCLPIAQTFLKIQSNAESKLLGKPSQQTEQLDVKAAVNMGADLLEEAVVWSVILGIMVWQMHNSSKKKKTVEKGTKIKLEEYKARLETLEALVEQLQHNKGQS